MTQLTTQERKAKIERYGQSYDLLVNALDHFPQEMWRFKPSDDLWSIHEIIIHIADSEANSYIRCRRMIAESGESVMAYDENRWAIALDYHNQPTGTALELFHWLRRSSFELIQTLPDAVWTNTVEHPEIGEISLDDWLTIYERHIPDHILQMQSVYAEWLHRNF